MSAPPADSLSFRIPRFVRLVWTSARARHTWHERYYAARRWCCEAEIASVLCGLRRNAIVVDPNVPRSAYLEPLSPRDVSDSPRYVAATNADEAGAFIRAWDARDWDIVFNRLGFPPCCAEHARSHLESLIDPLWTIAKNTTTAIRDSAVSLTIPPQENTDANLMLMRGGVRAALHTPCSFTCTPSSERCAQLLEEPLTDQQGGIIVRQMLSWPTQYTTLHGVAEVQTPVFKLVFDSDAVGKKRTVKLMGTSWPDEGAEAKRFPYLKPPTLIQLAPSSRTIRLADEV